MLYIYKMLFVFSLNNKYIYIHMKGHERHLRAYFETLTPLLQS